MPRLFLSVVSSLYHTIITRSITAAQSVLAAWIGICFFGSWFDLLVLTLRIGTVCLVQPVCLDVLPPLRASRSQEFVASGVAAALCTAAGCSFQGDDVGRCTERLGAASWGDTGIRSVILVQKNPVWAKLVSTSWEQVGTHAAKS